MQSGMVSCIITCFNSKDFIRDALNSIFGQTYGNMEIIAVDDGSSDDTFEILNQYAPKVRVLDHTGHTNRGTSASLNLAIRASRGEFIAFIDHDDVWLPEKTEKQIRILDQSEVGLVYANGIYINLKGSGNAPILPESFEESGDPASLLLDCHIKSPSAVMMKRSVIDSVGLFDETLTGCSDHDMWLRVIEKYTIRFISEPLYKYRIHEKQLSNSADMWLGGFRILEKARARYNYPVNVLRRRKAVLFYRLAEFAARNNRRLDALKYYLLAGLLDPFRGAKLVIRKPGVMKHISGR